MKVTKTIEQIDQELAQAKAELADLHGTETEVYARIVGYYRSVRNWNKGKRAEFNERRLFEYDGAYADSRGQNATALGNKTSDALVAPQAVSTESAAHYELFMRKTCPNCPPVKNYMANVTLEGTVIDVDTDEGLRQAASKGVFSAPTVIFYDADGNETGRGHTVEEIKAVLEVQKVVA